MSLLNLKNKILAGLAIIAGLTLFSGVAFAAPIYTTSRTIVPETNNIYYLGSTSPNLEWGGLYTKNVTLGTTTPGCAQISSGGLVFSTGVSCGTGAGNSFAYPFFTTQNFGMVANATTTHLWLEQGVSASTTSYFNTITNYGAYRQNISNGTYIFLQDLGNGVAGIGAYNDAQGFKQLDIDANTLILNNRAGNNVGVGATSSPYTTFSVAGSSDLGNSALAGFFVGTTTASSTLNGGLAANIFNATSAIASSTFANGINLTKGCYAIAGVCLPSISNTNFFTNVGASTTLNTGSIVQAGSFYGTSTATTTIPNFEGILQAADFPGVDLGAKVNATCNGSSPYPGSTITLPSGTSTYSTPILCNTPGKLPLLRGTTGTVLKYTGVGNAITMNVIGTSSDNHQGAWGVEQFTLIGPGSYPRNEGSTVGIFLGGSNGAEGAIVSAVSIQHFGTGLWIGANSYVTLVNNNTQFYLNGTSTYYSNSAVNSGERLVYDDVRFFDNDHDTTLGSAYQGCVVINGAASLSITNSSIDDCELYIGPATLSATLSGNHYENPGWPLNTNPGLYNAITIATSSLTHVSILGGTFMNDSTIAASTSPQLIFNGGNLTISGTTANQNGTQPIGNFITNAIGGGGASGSFQITGFKSQNSVVTNLYNGVYPLSGFPDGKIDHFDSATNSFGFGMSQDTGNNESFWWDGGIQMTLRQANNALGLGTTSPGTLLSLGNTGVNTINLDPTGTSTSGHGINILNGCYAIAGKCPSLGSGTVTSISTNNGLTGGIITTTGTLGLDLTSISNNALLTYNGTRLAATGTPQLTIGNLAATSTTATSTFSANISVGANYFPFVTFGTSTNNIDGGNIDALYVQGNSGSDSQISLHNITPGFGAYLKASANSNFVSTDLVGTNSEWKFGEFGATQFNLIDQTNSKTPFKVDQNSPTNSLYIQSTGNIGLGTSSPFASLSITSSSTSIFPFALATSSNKTLRFVDAKGNEYNGGDQITAGTCGTNPVIATSSNNNVGRVQTGSGVVTSCTLNFADGGWTSTKNAPVCRVDSEGAVNIALNGSTTPTTLVVTGLNFGADFFTYQCTGF